MCHWPGPNPARPTLLDSATSKHTTLGRRIVGGCIELAQANNTGHLDILQVSRSKGRARSLQPLVAIGSPSAQLQDAGWTNVAFQTSLIRFAINSVMLFHGSRYEIYSLHPKPNPHIPKNASHIDNRHVATAHKNPPSAVLPTLQQRQPQPAPEVKDNPDIFSFQRQTRPDVRS